MTARATAVVVDPNVFGADVLLPVTRPLAELYRPILAGRRYVISFQTAAEMRFGALRSGRGPERLAVSTCALAAPR